MAATASVHIYRCETQLRSLFCTHMLTHAREVQRSFVSFNSKSRPHPKQTKPPKHSRICTTEGGSPQLAEASDTRRQTLHSRQLTLGYGAVMHCTASRCVSAMQAHTSLRRVEEVEGMQKAEREVSAGVRTWSSLKVSGSSLYIYKAAYTHTHTQTTAGEVQVEGEWCWCKWCVKELISGFTGQLPRKAAVHFNTTEAKVGT